MVLQGWEDPVGALSNEVRLTCVAASRGDLKDSCLSDPLPLDVVTLWVGSFFLLLKLRGDECGKTVANSNIPFLLPISIDPTASRGQPLNGSMARYGTPLWTFPLVIASFTQAAVPPPPIVVKNKYLTV